MRLSKFPNPGVFQLVSFCAVMRSMLGLRPWPPRTASGQSIFEAKTETVSRELAIAEDLERRSDPALSHWLTAGLLGIGLAQWWFEAPAASLGGMVVIGALFSVACAITATRRRHRLECLKDEVRFREKGGSRWSDRK